MKRRESISPDITPLIDVVFLLLIFFLVSTVFKKEELALMLQLPEKVESAVAISPKTSLLEMDQNRLALDGRIVTWEELEVALRRLETDILPLQVLIDKTVPYERVIRLLDLLQQNGMKQAALSVKP